MQFEHNSLLILYLLINTSRHPNAHSRHHHHYHYYGSLTRSLAVRINRTITPTPSSLPLAAARRSLDGFRSTNQSSRWVVDDASLAFQIFINGIEIDDDTNEDVNKFRPFKCKLLTAFVLPPSKLAPISLESPNILFCPMDGLVVVGAELDHSKVALTE